ncbi:MAG TPA: hypothetical protein VND95_16205 [Stellaceae bacterium]|nr:hypothetical protein [Stellaceae bacterium]
MNRGLILAGLAFAVTGCTPAPHRDLASAVRPSEIAYVLCLQRRPGDDAACHKLRLPDPTSALAYGVCLQYHRLDVKACDDLRLAYETELRAYLAQPEPTVPSPLRPANRPRMTMQRAASLHKTAAALYKATSADAQTFTAALLIPQVRQKTEAVLRQPLSDAQLHRLAARERAEALYWYAYMQGLERAANTY